MNDIEKKDTIPSRSILSRLGINAIVYTVGGILLVILQIFSKIPSLGLIIGGIVSVIGITSFMSKDPADKKVGAFIMASGILIILSRLGIPIVKAASATILSIGAVGLFVMGIINGIKFLFGLKKRS